MVLLSDVVDHDKVRTSHRLDPIKTFVTSSSHILGPIKTFVTSSSHTLDPIKTTVTYFGHTRYKHVGQIDYSHIFNDLLHHILYSTARLEPIGSRRTPT